MSLEDLSKGETLAHAEEGVARSVEFPDHALQHDFLGCLRKFPVMVTALVIPLLIAVVKIRAWGGGD